MSGHYFINKNVPGMVAVASKLRTSNEDYYYCTPEKVWSPHFKKFLYPPAGKTINKLSKDKWEKKTKQQLVLSIQYGQFLRFQDEPIPEEKEETTE